MSRLAALLLTTCLMSLAATAFAATAAENERQSRDGTVEVSWEPGYAQYDTLLIQSARGESVAQYPVVDGQNWVITGMEDGQYQFILTASSTTHTLFTLDVTHYSLSGAFSLFIAGLLMFLYLVFTLIKGERGD
ncbi:hypothetical protein [Alteromonas sp. H39]|uniref:hypothetical protein n=1 Tax=Alteromonas sp. H39 TaxID=3389876 RepID=UPI0039E0ABA3